MCKITFTLIDTNDYDRTYRASLGDAHFDFVAQFWNSETGNFLGAGADAHVMHAGIKSPDDTSDYFTRATAWPAFAEKTGLEARALEEAFFELIEAQEESA